MKKNGKQLFNIADVIYAVLLALYFVACFYLFFNQLGYYETGRFESDTVFHVRFAVEDGYFHSFAAFIYFVLYKLPIGRILTAGILSITVIASIIATTKLIETISEKYVSLKKGTIYALSVSLNFVMAFYVPSANHQHYIGYQNPSVWHNSTYIFMKLFAILTLIAFMRQVRSYKEKYTFREWITLSLLLALATGFKPSFLTVFAPVFAAMLVVDLFKGTKFIQAVKFGSTVFLSIAVMLWESTVLYGDKSSGYAISPFTVLKERSENPKITIVLSVFFIALVFILTVKNFWKDRLYFWSLVLLSVGFLEVFLLIETGERGLDANFMWGYSISLFFSFLMAALRAIKCFKESRGRLRFGIFCVEILVFAWHVISGIWFFALLLTGVTYFV